jgi:uncharacterized membrane protein
VPDPSSAATVSLQLNEDELLGLHILATMEGVAEDDAAGLADMANFTLRRGIAERLEGVGLDWPPTEDTLKTARRAAVQASPTDHDDVTAVSISRGVRSIAIVALTVAAVVVLIGGYAFHWKWTGFEDNNQLWDWFHLLLLPVAFGTFPLWLSFSGYMTATRRRTLAAAVAAFLLFVALGYLAPLIWTGFKGQTLWDWLTLIVLPIALITVRAWPKSGRDIRRGHIVAAAVLMFVWFVTIIGGYAGSWKWTGYPGNTLWDWLTLLLAPIAITAFAAPKLASKIAGGAEERAEEERWQNIREKALSAARERAGVAT